MAVFPAVHYPDASLSHFDSQHHIESGSPKGTMDGWLNRHLTIMPGEARLRAVAFSYGLPHALKGEASVVTFTNLGDLGLEGGALADESGVARCEFIVF